MSALCRLWHWWGPWELYREEEFGWLRQRRTCRACGFTQDEIVMGRF